jgi:hypothetical protein
MKYLTWILFFIVYFLSCTYRESSRQDILPEKKMRDVVWDLMKADQFVSEFLLKDSTLDRKMESEKYYDEVFRIHNITADQFKKSWAYYQSNPELFKPIIDSIAGKRGDEIYKPIHPFKTDSLTKIKTLQ